MGVRLQNPPAALGRSRPAAPRDFVASATISGVSSLLTGNRLRAPYFRERCSHPRVAERVEGTMGGGSEWE